MNKHKFITGILLFSITFCFSQNQVDIEYVATSNNDAAVNAIAINPDNNPPTATVGVRGISQAANGVGLVGNGNTGVNATGGFVGVYATGTRAVWGVSDDFAGYFQGNVEVTGTFSNPSDRKLKSILKNNDIALPLILQLKPTTYKYKTDVFPELNLRDGIQIGFIAQELEEIFPHMVSDSFKPETYNSQGELVSDRVDYKTVNYLDLIPVLTQGLQELSSIVNRQNIIIEKQRNQLEAIASELSNLKNTK